MNASPQSLLTRRIKVEDATPESVAPFGRLLGRQPEMNVMPVSFYGDRVITSRPVDYSCDTRTELSLAMLKVRPFRVQYLERHFHHTQTFIPLGGKPFAAVFAPPTDADLPDLDAARAFRFDGSAGFCMHLGTWHEFPFPLVDDTDVVVVISSQTSQDLRQRATNGIEAFGPDLDKKDMTMRYGTVIELEF